MIGFSASMDALGRRPSMLGWLRRWFSESNGVSPQWLADHRLQAGKAGWDGPRWRFPKELIK